MNPQFPIFIPSKGRFDSRITMRAFDAMGVPYRVIVEAQEFESYAAALGRERLLVLDPAFQRDYDTCDEHGGTKCRGSGPARNFAWHVAAGEGAPWHWVVDDNIKGFFRFNRNLKVPVADGTVFRCMEDLCLRYRNIAMAGPQYFMFVVRKTKLPPLVLNTRVYSCNLIRTDAPFRWRARYNEDVDLSLRMLKAGWVTVLFNAFLQYKLTTQTVVGGNTDAFYAREGTAPKSEMIARLHPDVARVAWRFGRVHHHVDYRPFRRNRLVLRQGVAPPAGVDDYGMRLVEVNS